MAILTGFTYGPQSFLADEKRNIFYLSDSANSRLLALDKGRALINSFLGLNPKKNIYVAVEERSGPKDLKRILKKLDFNGVILAVSEIP